MKKWKQSITKISSRNKLTWRLRLQYWLMLNRALCSKLIMFQQFQRGRYINRGRIWKRRKEKRIKGMTLSRTWNRNRLWICTLHAVQPVTAWMSSNFLTWLISYQAMLVGRWDSLLIRSIWCKRKIRTAATWRLDLRLISLGRKRWPTYLANFVSTNPKNEGCNSGRNMNWPSPQIWSP